MEAAEKGAIVTRKGNLITIAKDPDDQEPMTSNVNAKLAAALHKLLEDEPTLEVESLCAMHAGIGVSHLLVGVRHGRNRKLVNAPGAPASTESTERRS